MCFKGLASVTDIQYKDRLVQIGEQQTLYSSVLPGSTAMEPNGGSNLTNVVLKGEQVSDVNYILLTKYALSAPLLSVLLFSSEFSSRVPFAL